MKKALVLLKVLILSTVILSQLSCDNDCSYPLPTNKINVNQEYSHTIKSEGSTYYVFTTTEAGSYAISVTERGAHLNWILVPWISNCREDYITDNYLILNMVHKQDIESEEDETAVVSLEAETRYVLNMNENSETDSHYTLEIFSPAP